MGQKETSSVLIDRVLDTIIKKSLKEIKDFILQNWHPETLEKRGVKSILDSLHHIKRELDGVEIYQTFKESPEKESAILLNPETEDWIKFSIMISEEEPFLVKGLGLRPTSPPKDIGVEVKEEDLASAIGDSIKGLLDKNLFSGVVIVAKENKIVFQLAHGYSNVDSTIQLNLDTKFNLGSMNKMFTSLAIAKHIEEGHFSFDSTVAELLPEAQIDQSEQIKVHHLLTHSSGLGSFFSAEYMKKKDQYVEVKDLLPLIEKEQLSFSPGSSFQYSNSGFEVLGNIIERVSGMTYYDYVRENIFLPLDMNNTDSYRLDDDLENLAIGYTKHLGMNQPPSKEWVANTKMARIKGSAAGGGYSSAHDLLTFSQALFSYKILNEDLTKEVLSGKIRLEPGSDDIMYGYGFGIHQFGNITRYGHNGGAPGINSFFGVYLPINYTVIVLSNYDPPSAERIGNKIHSILSKMKK
ncbi:MAG: beta-lactamase family protein [Candidatus Heimdallarchaeota archaeon]|nr:beta-lactamase family protein [Candidatus Heimdallarchaeota archaeon]